VAADESEKEGGDGRLFRQGGAVKSAGRGGFSE
jgi:hypothetical protein